jgi:hypothetical protein
MNKNINTKINTLASMFVEYLTAIKNGVEETN